MSIREVWVMSPEQVCEARRRLSELWGHDVTPAELAREIGLAGEDPGLVVVKWEKGTSIPSGPCSRLLLAMLEGFRPSQHARALEGRMEVSGLRR